jgi:histidine phosphotransferase ChpT
MSQLHPAFEPPHGASVAPEELAARLASKLCHDFISPAGAIVSGLDLLDDPSAKDMRDDAMELIAATAP